MRIFRIVATFLLIMFGALFLRASAADAESKVLKIMGKVEIMKAVEEQWKPVQIGDILASGDKVQVTGTGAAILEDVDSGVRLNVLNDSMLEYKGVASGDNTEKYKVPLGTIWFKIRKGTHLDVITPVLVASVRGTEFSAKVKKDGSTSVSVTEGKVGVVDALGRSSTLTEGQSLSVSASDAGITTQPSTPGGTQPDTGDPGNPDNSGDDNPFDGDDVCR